MPELLSCPFCGWEKPFLFDTREDPFWVECPDCFAEGPTEETANEAIAAWNTRSQSARPTDEGVVERVWLEVRVRLNRLHREGAITYGELKHGVNSAALIRDAALQAIGSTSTPDDRADFSRITLRTNIEGILRRYSDAHPNTLVDKIMSAVPRLTASSTSTPTDVEGLKAENRALRCIIAELGYCVPEASIEFMRLIPAEVEAKIAALRAKSATDTRGFTDWEHEPDEFDQQAEEAAKPTDTPDDGEGNG